jgi:hypothetical protein
MGVSYDYFRAALDETAQRAGEVVGGPVVAGSTGVVETKWVDPWVRVGRLHFQIAGRPWTYDGSVAVQVLPELPIGPDDWELPTVHRLSDEVRDSFASVADDDASDLGRWWAGTEEFVLDRADPTYVASLCIDLLTLCREARDAGEHVYVWSAM